MSSPEEVVREFCDVIGKRDADLLRPLLADDVVYHNIGMPATVGRDAVIANIEGQWQMFSAAYHFETHNIAVTGTTVLTERTDTVGTGDNPPFPYPVMGTFVIENEKIVAWRDYFDSAITGKIAEGGDPTVLLPSL